MRQGLLTDEEAEAVRGQFDTSVVPAIEWMTEEHVGDLLALKRSNLGAKVLELGQRSVSDPYGESRLRRAHAVNILKDQAGALARSGNDIRWDAVENLGFSYNHILRFADEFIHDLCLILIDFSGQMLAAEADLLLDRHVPAAEAALQLRQYAAQVIEGCRRKEWLPFLAFVGLIEFDLTTKEAWERHAEALQHAIDDEDIPTDPVESIPEPTPGSKDYQDRRLMVDFYRGEVLQATGKKLTYAAYRKSAGDKKDRTEFDRWISYYYEKHGKKTNLEAHRRFMDVLRRRPHLT